MRTRSWRNLPQFAVTKTTGGGPTPITIRVLLHPTVTGHQDASSHTSTGTQTQSQQDCRSRETTTSARNQKKTNSKAYGGISKTKVTIPAKHQLGGNLIYSFSEIHISINIPFGQVNAIHHSCSFPAQQRCNLFIANGLLRVQFLNGEPAMAANC